MNHSTLYTDFFLGTTTPAGFRGYFDELTHEPGRQAYLIKSGPGCGKSTLMKHLALRGGQEVQRIHCSSDPDSLDGVVFCASGAAVLDATAPHTLEPSAPGADEIVIGLYDSLRAELLRPHREAIRALFARNACLRARASRYIASAGSLLLDNRRAAAFCTDFPRVRRYAARLCARLLPRRDGTGSEQLRLLSAITPRGELFYADTVPLLADRIIAFDDEYGAVSRVLMEQIRAAALASGQDIITCPCALHPDDKIDHILIPALRLAFVTSNPWHPCRYAGQQNVHCTRFSSGLSACRSRLRFNRRAADELIAQAVDLMAQAKSCHDELENYYRAAVDFRQVEAQTERCARLLGLTAQDE